MSLISKTVTFVDLSALLEVHKQVLKQRDEFYQESERLRQSATPRPDWEKCADVIPGGKATNTYYILRI